ncbi:MAG: hypothetical protein C5B59_03450 [Bacteroidetes bacterium]|nr:MAG: hypothetical protein C5B59_03450 [Bacteroidota bacterium]
MKILSRQNVGFLVMSTLISISSCKKNGGYGSNVPAPPQPDKDITIKTDATFGKYLVDKLGRSLYFFSNDADGKNHCTGPCEVLWPTFNLDSLNAQNLGEGLVASDFSHITTNAGRNQLTYKGWPLYQYAPLTNGTNVQESPGQTGGDGFLNIWFIAKPNYTIMIVNTQLVGKDGRNYQSDYTVGNQATSYFSDGKGVTLYTFSKDSANNNNFTLPDFSNDHVFPIDQEEDLVIPSILDKTDFGKINVFGKNQVTYKGWPLYYFGGDSTVRGSNKAVSVPRPGIWPVPNKNITPAP